ncbi:uncharacterized protein LOC132095581, partial [Carassius carassius]|uniref:uncharacterized protein LOC132095581 n=1 Tax=Carassius carassius TaxID=217509 RepID=UPI002868BFC8
IQQNLALKGKAVQSTTYSTCGAANAIDGIRYSPSGKPYPDETYTYCSITDKELNPWWRLDLLDYYSIYNVTVTNRNECCPEQTSGVEICIGNSLENNGNNNPRCGVTSLVPAGSSVSFSCGGMEGRYVNMYLPNIQEYLVLCEVEVYGTVSRKKQVTRVQVKAAENVDEAELKELVLNKLNQTLSDQDVILTWRTQPNGKVFQKNRTWVVLRYMKRTDVFAGCLNFVTVIWVCVWLCVCVRVRVWLAACESSLSDIHSHYIPEQYINENLALKGKAVQSTTYSTCGAANAIDGIRYSPSGTPHPAETYTYCSHTAYELSPWWRLDLLDYYSIYNVTVTNRGDCCPERTTGIEIRIGNSLENNGNNNPRCGVTSLVPAGSSFSFSCGGMEGRYVNMYLPNIQEYLVLCEVEVYGTVSRKKQMIRVQVKAAENVDEAELKALVLNKVVFLILI